MPSKKIDKNLRAQLVSLPFCKVCLLRLALKFSPVVNSKNFYSQSFVVVMWIISHDHSYNIDRTDLANNLVCRFRGSSIHIQFSLKLVRLQSGSALFEPETGSFLTQIRIYLNSGHSDPQPGYANQIRVRNRESPDLEHAGESGENPNPTFGFSPTRSDWLSFEDRLSWIWVQSDLVLTPHWPGFESARSFHYRMHGPYLEVHMTPKSRTPKGLASKRISQDIPDINRGAHPKSWVLWTLNNSHSNELGLDTRCEKSTVPHFGLHSTDIASSFFDGRPNRASAFVVYVINR